MKVDSRLKLAVADEKAMDALLKELNDHEIKKSKLEKFVDTVTEGQRSFLNESSILNQSNNMISKYENKGLNDSMAAGLGNSNVKSF